MSAYREPGQVQPTLTPEEERAFWRAIARDTIDSGQFARGLLLVILLDLLAVAVFALLTS